MSLVVIGLDGFHEDILQFTPNIRALYEEEASGPLESTTPPVTAPAWTSFQTGVNQGKHGVFDFVKYDTDLKPSFVDGRDLLAKPFYETLDDAGFDCYLQNLPFGLPARIDGDIAPSWLDDDDADPVPSDLFEEYDVAGTEYPELGGESVQNIEEMKSCFTTNAATFQTVLEEDDHDFYFFLASCTDWLQHEAYLQLKESPDSKIAMAARELLSEVDGFVAEVLEHLPTTTDVLLLSDHGFRRYDGNFHINDWLKGEGYLVASNDGHRFTVDDGGSDETVVESGSFGQWIRKQWFWRFLRPFKDATESVFDVEFSIETGVDIEASVAYCRSKSEKAIHFNEDHPGYHPTLADEIISKLNESGFVSARDSDQLYHGEFADEAGAIVVDDGPFTMKRGPFGQTIVEQPVSHHSPDGIFIGIGERFDGGPNSAKLIDVAPTLLHLFEKGIPRSIDGEVLAEALADTREIQYQQSQTYEPRFRDTDAKEPDVEDRLDNLGYL